MTNEKKKSTNFWLYPSVVSRMDGWLTESQCANRSEFVDKALRFYMGYLAAEDTTEYLSPVLANTLKTTVQENQNRLRSLLFKCAVELNMLCHVISAHFKADPIDLKMLRSYAVDEVKRTNGKLKLFDNALNIQRQLPLDDEWEE